MKTTLTLISISLITLLLAGCGQTGALYLTHTPTTEKERKNSRPLPNSYTQKDVEYRTQPTHHNTPAAS